MCTNIRLLEENDYSQYVRLKIVELTMEQSLFVTDVKPTTCNSTTY